MTVLFPGEMRAGRRSAWRLVAAAAAMIIAVLAGQASAAAPAAQRLALWDAAAAPIVRKLEGGLGSVQAFSGGVLRRSVQRSADGQTVVVDGVCDGPAAEAPLLDFAFRLRDASEENGFGRLVYREDTWYGSTFWSGPDWTRVGKDWHHPGEHTPSVRCWRAPQDGHVTVAGRVYKLHLQGDGIRANILHNGREIWKAEIDGRDDTGVEPQLSLDVRRGDTLRFVVHKRGGIACDTTHWDPRISYAGGKSTQASAAFGPQQGRDGWFYEMVGQSNAVSLAAPVVYALGRDLSLRQTATASEAQDLPLLVIADDYRSAIAVALDGATRWRLNCSDAASGVLHIQVLAAPDASGKLPRAVLTAAKSPWHTLLPQWQERLSKSTRPAYEQFVAPLRHKPDWGLFLMAQAEWRLDDAIVEMPVSYRAAVTNHLARAKALLEQCGAAQPIGHAERLAGLLRRQETPELGLDDLRRLYLETRLLKRDVALSQPGVAGGPWLFCKRAQPSYSHLVGQYFGWRQRPGGGLFVLERPGCSLATRDVVGGQLPAGSYLEPRLSYDARRIAFSFVACSPDTPDARLLPVNEEGDDQRYYHLYEIGVDGRSLRQLTSGPYDDMMPCYLPDDGLAFVSTRRRSYSRCFGPSFSKRWHSYTLHRLDADGLPRILSVNDVSEWFPAVANTGEILFARWDYIDRDAVTHQNLWAMRPDGTNPVAVWGNATPKPHCTFQARPIPGSRKLVFIASAHHAVTGGPVCLLDPAVDPNSQEAITRLTPGPYPEAEGSKVAEYYQSPWPLSQSLFLVAYSRDRLIFEGEHMRNPNPDDALGLYLLDAAGNRELIYRDSALNSTCPMPLRPQPRPPMLPSSLPPHAPPQGEMVVSDIYQGLGDVPRGTIKELRIVQIFPKTTWLANSPRIGTAGEENARAILGTVPVQPDGSARFLVPAHKPILFQALDADGNAYQTMRSITSVQPGERTSCIGCHEHRMSAPPPMRAPLAMQHPPTPIAPGELGGRPFSFMDVVQPVLERHCVRCHGGEKTEQGVDLTAKAQDGFTRSYWALCGTALGKAADAVKDPLVPRYVMRNQIQMTVPGGALGARGSRLMKLLRDGHAEVRLSDGDLRRLAAWIDCNAVFYGSFDPDQQLRELSGEPTAMPRLQ